jgi:phosphotransferase system  glucose/maltose/N-acetylglucosamine-specific IIC component
MEMKKNVGSSDRYIRFIIGLGFILNIFSLQTGKLGTFIFLALGLLMFFSAYTRYCFLYDIFKINTTGEKNKSSEQAEQAPQ